MNDSRYKYFRSFLQDEDSLLRNGQLIRNLDPSYSKRLMFACSVILTILTRKGIISVFISMTKDMKSLCAGFH